MKKNIKNLLEGEGIFSAHAIPFSACRVILPRKLSAFGFSEGEVRSALLFAVPYYAGEERGRTVSVYAAARDYHLYFDGLFSRLLPALADCFPGYRFGGSADNAPIDERHGAVRAGLGVIGDNGLLLTERYGSYVFIGEILSDLPVEAWYDDPGDATVFEERYCSHCGACKKACPMNGNNPYGIKECLSEVTQRKKITDPLYLSYIRYYGSAWGCDRCQTACPYNRHPELTPIPFFREQLTPAPDHAAVAAMDDASFFGRAYAWRGREPILRNLALLEADRAEGCVAPSVAFAIEDAVRQAGKGMLEARGKASEIRSKEGSANFVTEYDVRVQRELTEALARILPEGYMIAEEQDNDYRRLSEGYCFILDPIDGTTNFIRDLGASAISLALLWRGTPVLSFIYDPYREEMFSARKGLGAFLNGKPIHVKERPLCESVFCMGTTPYYKDTTGDITLSAMRTLLMEGADLRRSGSAAIDLASVACGRTDGFFEVRLSPWDYAAASLLIVEAGGFMLDTNGDGIRYTGLTGVIAGTEGTKDLLLRAAGRAVAR